MQIEDWKHTLNKDFSCYSNEFAEITKKHRRKTQQITIFRNYVY